MLILLQNLSIQSLSTHQGTISSSYGRISNIPNSHIYVSNALYLADCVRQCVDFTVNHNEFTGDECFAYNYDFDRHACELIHSNTPTNYQISFETRWKTGFKY